jgi:predicted tellurium resistance membrane protein TerC
MYAPLQQIIDNPLAALAVVGNLIVIESLLSVDNAAVLATMVGDLPPNSAKRPCATASSAPMCFGECA